MIALASLIPSGIYHPGLALVVACAALLLFVSGPKKSMVYIKDKRFLIPASIWVLVVVSAIFSNNKSEALSSLSVYLPFLLVPFSVFATESFTRQQVETVLTAFISGLCLSLLYCDVYSLVSIILTGETTVIENGVYSYHKFSSSGLTAAFKGWHPTYVACFAVWAIIFIYPYVASGSRMFFFNQKILWLILAFLLIHIVLLNSIAAIAAGLVVTGIAGVNRLRSSSISSATIAFSVLITICLLISFVWINPLHNVKIATVKARGFVVTDKEGERNFLTIRLAKWRTHVDLFSAYPLFGVTPGDIKDERKIAYQQHGFNNLAEINYNAHNQYLEVLTRLGILGFIMFVLYFCYPALHKNSNTIES
ncbi:MAG: O-antigen ligase domain-containing protein, partial [Sphingobacteriales bacterium]